MVDFELSTFKSLHPDASEPTGLLRNEEDERERERKRLFLAYCPELLVGEVMENILSLLE